MAIMIGTFLLLRKLQKQDAKKPESQQDHLLYQSPKSSSLLLAGLLFPVVFPPTTSLMYDFALLISYFPFLFILRSTLDLRSFRVYLVFFIFLLLLKIQGIFSTNSGFWAVITILAGAVFIYTISSQTLRKFFNIRWKWVVIFNWILVGLTVLGIACILLQRVRLGNILIDGAGETIALGLILFYFANWSDHFIGYVKQLPRFRDLAKNKTKLDEFWHTWSNRIYMVLLLIFVVAFLKNFSLYTAAKDRFFAFFETERVLGELTFTYGGVALFLIVIYLATKISSTIKFLTEDKSYYKSKKQTANMAVIFRFFLITVGFLLALLVSGIPLDRVTIILGALSVGIGFGLQSVVNNLISGIILIFERPVQTGDLVELQQYTGFIKDIGIRSSVIRTYEGAEVIVPNANLITQEVINWTLSNRERRVEMRVGVAYGSDVEQVTEVIGKVLKDHDKVENYPAPAVLLDGFGDSSIDFRCLIWTTDIDNWLKIKSELSTSIYNALNEANITIPFPQRDLHVISWKAGPPKQQTDSKPDQSIPEAENDRVGTGFEASGTEGD
jgi:small-conductance mechanosensitive channel